jgi:hypothetical protein
MAWTPVPPQDLATGALIRCGALHAHVEGWRWRVDRAEFIVDVRYADSAPAGYRGADTQIVLRDGETALVWCDDQGVSAL